MYIYNIAYISYICISVLDVHLQYSMTLKIKIFYIVSVSYYVSVEKDQTPCKCCAYLF